MDTEAFEHHLTSPQGEGHLPDAAFTVKFGGGACCDEISFSVQTDGVRVTDAGFTAEGCGASHAAASAAVSLIRGKSLLDAARVGQSEIAQELGGLSAGKLHAAAVAVDAMARALGNAVRVRGAMDPPPSTRDDARVAEGGAHARHTSGRGTRTDRRLVANGRGTRSDRTLVAMSGGVDSSVVALLCARDSEAVAVTLELWADPENDSEKSCCSSSAVSQARALAHQLGLPHFTLDLRDEFRSGVVEPFIESYAGGDTPNPCIGCNGHVRLDAMLDFADRLGCRTLATGHYARVHNARTDAQTDRVNGLGRAEAGTTPLLQIAVDPAKDQTYMLSALKPQTLARMRFPLGDYEKPQVRRIAAEAGMPVATKSDSQDLCFLAGTDRARFLTRHGARAPQTGDIVSTAGTVLGQHSGHELYTVGQRKGIGVGALNEPLYVIDKDAATNRVIVGGKDQLLTSRVRVRGARLHRDGACVDRVKLRYRSQPLAARITVAAEPGRHRELTLELDEPVAGAAPGQLACLMSGELIVGWATITRGDDAR